MTAIPYTTDVRPDTGVTNPKLGMWLFLASEVMLFGSLLSAYVLLRSGALTWPDQSAVLSVPLATVNTVILIASSVTMLRAWTALTAGNMRQYRVRMGVTLVLGAVFLAIKTFEYSDKFAHGLGPATDNFLGLYFVLTGVHVLHLAGGMLVNAFLLGPGARMWRSDPRRFTQRVEVAAIYWHFVDAVWLVLFVVLYLL
ncbi:MAG: cytochrome c oxidase subunit 3 [Acidobacteria bacterium]|nr:cytochrome c oxidase subunit 3 [Acidobacteriota bacterium]